MKEAFSRRTNWDTAESDLAAAVLRAAAEGRKLIDLTSSNPTTCGFVLNEKALLSPLGDPGSLVYRPEAAGSARARASIVDYYLKHYCEILVEDILITASSSEGYSHLLKLLCDAGDEILVPQPSYPLFDYLGDLQDVALKSYPLFYDFGWWIDLAELERRIGPRTRAIVVVHPNNPTGHVTGRSERVDLERLCERYGLALLVDEVFLDYPLGEGRIESFAAPEHPVLTFILSGLSKVAALPQMKVGWIVVLGPPRLTREAIKRLEVIADTYLSVSTPALLALPAWMEGRFEIQGQILVRIRQNLLRLQELGLQVLRTEAGWSAVVRLGGMDRWMESELEVLQECDLVVHPGRFYGLAGAGLVVVSLLTPPEELEEAAKRLRKMELRLQG